MGQMKKSNDSFIMSHIISFNDISEYLKTRDEELYKLSQKYVVKWCFSALKSKEVIWKNKYKAIVILKKLNINKNPFLRKFDKLLCYIIRFIP